MSHAPGLDGLLTGLRDAGLRIGVTEVARLHQVFALEPEIAGGHARRRLKSLLRAVVVKSADDRGAFDRVADAWIDSADPEPVQQISRLPQRIPELLPRKRQYPRWPSLIGAAAILLCAMVLMFINPPRPRYLERKEIDDYIRIRELLKETPTAPLPLPATATTTNQLELPTPDEVRQQTFTTWVPTLEVTPAQPSLHPRSGSL